MKTLNFLLLFFFLFSINSYSLPKCKGTDSLKWNKCIGTNIKINSYIDFQGYKEGTYKYSGEWKNGSLHGQGVIILLDGPFAGDKYEGQFKNGTKNGFGVFTWHNGDKYVGEYRKGKRHGKGVSTFIKGDKYEGEYEDDNRNGWGLYTCGRSSCKGDKYEGEYRDGLKHGKGTLTFADGYKWIGIWERGQLIKSEYEGY